MSLPSLLFAAVLFGYYDNAVQNPLDRHAQMREHATYANLTGAVRPWVEADWQLARDLHLQVFVGMPYEMFLAIDVDRPLIPQMDLGWWAGLGFPTVASWLNMVNAHRDQIAFIGVSDEYDCGGGVWYPIDTNNCRRAAAKIEAVLSALRTYTPGVKLHVNYTSQWASHFSAYRTQTWRLDYYGIRLASADYIGFDCYFPFGSCARTGTEILSVEALITHWKPWMRPDQRIALIPRAFAGSFLGWAPSQSELDVMALQYYSYAQSEPLVREGGVMLPFIWWTVPGVGSAGAAYVPAISRLYTQIGMWLTGRPGPAPPPPPPPPPGPVTGLRIVR